MNEFLYKQLEQEYAIKIEQGYWQTGDRLPSVRSLCQQRNLSKATVLHAYGRLEARGLIEARAKSGYFVTNSFKNNSIFENSNPNSVPLPVTVTEVIRDIMSQSAAFDLLPNSDQRVDTPASIIALNRCIARALRHQRGYAHQYYDEPLGCSQLREQISRRYQRLGCLLRPEQLAITAGCQQALFLALMSCCKPGDVVAIESPGFYGALQLAEALELQVLEIP